MPFTKKAYYDSFTFTPDLLDVESYYYYQSLRRKNTIVYDYRQGHPLSWFISIFTLIILSILLIFIYLTDDARIFFSVTASTEAPKNVIMMISDGFGPASETFARQYHTWQEQLDVSTLLPLDEIHLGQSRTQSSSSLVTDSAAGATAFACSRKSHNGAVGVDPKDQPCGTVLESAKLHHNMLTGLVVTSRVTHATPAAFSAHVPDRDQEDWIAEQQVGMNPLGRTVDLIFGGGYCHFYGNSTEEGCRTDDRHLLEEAKQDYGWSVVLDRADFDALPEQSALPLMAMFSPSHMDYEMDRDEKAQPSLKEMAQKALSILQHASVESGNGFFLMIEGSRIDMAAHTNDPAAHLHDIWEYQQTVELVKSFVKEHPNTVLVSTSDHETGGFTAGRQVGEVYPEYKWNPEVISRVKKSSETLANVWSSAVNSNSASMNYLRDVIFEHGLGITDATAEESNWFAQWKNDKPDALFQLSYRLSDMVSRRALIGWTTHGHTAVDVNLYAMGPTTEYLRGSHENTDIGDFISAYLNLDLDDITERLNKDEAFMRAAIHYIPQTHVDDYHH